MVDFTVSPLVFNIICSNVISLYGVIPKNLTLEEEEVNWFF